MREDQTVTVDDGRVTVSHGPALTLHVRELYRTLPGRRVRIEVLCALEVSAPTAGGRLTITTRDTARRRRTALVGAGERYRVLSRSRGDGPERTFSLTLRRGQLRRLIVVEHPAGLAPADVIGLLPAPDVFWQPARARGPRRMKPPSARALPPPEAAMREMALEALPEAEPVPPPPAAAMAEAPPPAEPVFAQVGASMPATVHLDDAVPVEVRLSRGEVHIVAGRSHDEQVIVMDPGQPLDVTLLRRGFALDPPETGQRSLRLPAAGANDVKVVFWLRAAQEGEGEVQVIVRQRQAQPLATLRLTATVLARSAVPADRATAEAAAAAGSTEQQAMVAPGVTPFLAPKTLTIDENLVGSRSELSFELVLHGVRRTFPSLVVDKNPLLAAVFSALDEAWSTNKHIADPQEKHAAFHESLRSLGAMLAREALPRDLLLFLRHHLTDVGELTIITSGETDIPWELVHVWDEDSRPEPDGSGFLGRAGLVRWVYNTPHPRRLRVRRRAAHHLVPTYRDSSLLLSQTSREIEYLRPFGATAVRPADGDGLARLLHEDDIDLLHFAGHGRSDDSSTPPVREMLLAGARRVESRSGRRAARSKVAFGLDDLQRALADRPQRPEGVPGPLVVLNACRLGQAPSTRSEVGGFAETFLRGGAGAFVGCLWSVGDEPARAFVEAFYAELDRGSSMAHATVTAREAARAGGDLSWLAYTVYAHPDATLSPRPQQQRGTVMTTTTTARKVELSRAQLVALHPYVIDIPDGKLADGPSTAPTSVKDFKTTKADVDAIFDTYLPSFIAGRDVPVPMVVWAHGGLVGKDAGLAVANLQVDWWKANGVFPVHFVWETGLADSLWDAVKDSLPGRSRGLLDDAKDKAVEVVVRAVPASIATWGAMKTTARLASEKDTGGAWYFAKRLGQFMKDNPGSITVHTAGHSAGSIFHSYLIPEILAAGVPSVASLDLLAPAIRVAEFKDRLMKKSVLDKIDRLAMFTMSEAQEKKDTCIGVYGKSLLYLIRASLEKEPRAEILGLQECVRRDDDLTALFGAPGSGSKGEVMWSKTAGGGPFSSTTSTTHGGFDNNAATMDSLARRVLGRADLPSEFPGSGQRAIGDDVGLWPTQEEAYAYIESRQAMPSPAADEGRRRALCIGIDAYPAQYRLSGCVADAEAWKAAFEQAGFSVELLTNKQATRERMVEMIKDLVVSSRAGDVLALQYSGHGTTVEDFDHDEAEEFGGDTALVDEAICPVDFPGGNLLIDDDLGEIWDQLPDGVSLTIFFDSCHSGGSQRDLTLDVPTAPDAKARIVVLSARAVAAYRQKRGKQRTARAAGDNNERGVFFAACRPDEVAWESNGQGDFTRIAVPLLRQALVSSTNEDYFEKVTRAFGAKARQTPVLRPEHLATRRLLAPAVAEQKAGSPTDALPDPTPFPTIPPGPVTARDRAIAQLLRSVANLIET